MTSGVAKVTSKWENGDLVFYAGGNEICRFTPNGGLIEKDGVKSLVITSTTAQVNAGRVILEGIAGKQITVLDAKMISTGNAADATSVDLTDTTASPVAVVKWAIAALTNGTVAFASSEHATHGAGFLAPLAAGRGVKIIKNGTDLGTATAVKTILLYRID